MEIEALNDYVIIAPDIKGDTTKSGLHIARSEGERTEAVALKGKIVSLPAGLMQKKSKYTRVLKSSDIVLVNKFDVAKARVGEKEYYIVKYENVLAVIV